MSQLVYFSSSSENTQRFIERLGLPAVRIPLNERERIQVASLVDRCPLTAAAVRLAPVPRQVIRFLNDESITGRCCAALLLRVIATLVRHMAAPEM